MDKKVYPNPVVTFLIEYKGKFLLLHRNKNEKNYADLWAFPGGKVEVGETFMEAIVREAMEETGLSLKKQVAFLNSYFFGSSVGVTFLVRATSDKIILAKDFQNFGWVSSLQDMKKYKCIPGIYNHLQGAIESLKKKNFLNMQRANLLKEEYRNKE